MKKISESLSAKLWFYYSIVILLLSAVVVYYFTNKQQESITKYRKIELVELSRNIAMGVELSLEDDNYQQLNKSIKYYQTRKDAFDFLYLILGDSLGKNQQLFAQIGEQNTGYPNINKSNFIIAETAVKTKQIQGKIIIGINKEKVKKEVQSSNKPIYILLLGTMLLIVIVFYFLAQAITNPIKNAIKNAKILKTEEFSNFKEALVTGNDEISELQKVLLSLRDTLISQRNENKHLLSNLEYKINERTQSLNETLSLLNEAQSIASLGYFTYYIEKDKIIFSENLIELLNLSTAGTYSLRELTDIIDPDYLPIIQQQLVQKSEGSFNFEVKTNIFDADCDFSKWLFVSGSCKYDKQSNDYKISGIIQLITSQKKSQAEVNRLSHAVRDSSTSIIITDLSRKIVWVNDSALKLTGYSREEMNGNTPKMFQFEGTNKATIATINNNLSNFTKFKVEIENQSKSGKTYWLELYVQPIINEVGKPEGFIAIEIDITDRKAKEKLINNYILEIENKQKEIIQMNENLAAIVTEKTKNLESTITQLKQSQDEIVKKEKMAVIGVLVSGIAHEINNPLGAIKASVDNLTYLFSDDLLKFLTTLSTEDLKKVIELYNQYKQLPKFTTLEQRKHIKKLSDEIQKQYADIVNHKEFAQLLVEIGIVELNNEIGHLITQPSFIQLLHSVRILINIKRSMETINEGATKGARIIRALGLYSYNATQNHKQAFNLNDSITNVVTLLWNKIKYKATLVNSIPEKLEIAGYEDELSQVWLNIINNALQACNTNCSILIGYEFKDNMHRITISNDGPKIPEDIISKIFDEFFTTKKRGEGTGLGLNIVRKIIDKHGGKISCTSDDKFTSFTIDLPIT
jgi:PAS domain S-box-containing protein